MTRANNQLSIHLPSGAQASFEEMQAYGNILQSFICKQEALLQEIGDVDLSNKIESITMLFTVLIVYIPVESTHPFASVITNV